MAARPFHWEPDDLAGLVREDANALPEGQRAKQRPRSEWAELILHLDASGLDLEEFARQVGVKATSLKTWRSRLKPGSAYRRNLASVEDSVSRTRLATRVHGVRQAQERREGPREDVERSRPTHSEPRGPRPLTERLVDLLDVQTGLTTRSLALELGEHRALVRTELHELEALGILVTFEMILKFIYHNHW